MSARVLVLGLDGADPGLIARLCDQGHCPTIARLRAGGATHLLVNPIGWSDDAAWASFSTGTGIGQHGRYHGPNQHYPKVYGPQPFSRRPFEFSTFWERLDTQGKACAVLDVPKSPLSKALRNSRQLADWLVHGRDHPIPVSQPTDWAADVIARHGAAPPSPCGTYQFQDGVPLHDGFSAQDAARWTRSLAGSARQKGAAACEVLGEKDWDLAVVVFKEIHCASHLFWDAPEPLERVYQEVDQQIARVLLCAGPNAKVILFAPHGMQHSHTATLALGPLIDCFNQSRRHGFAGLAYRTKSLAAALVGRRLGEAHDLVVMVDHNEAAGALRLNVKGREPMGKVTPGDDYEAVCAELTALINGLTEARTGKPLVSEVIRPQLRDSGPNAANLPDLLAIWANDTPVEGVVSDVFGALPLPAGRVRPGNHTNIGFVTTHGTGLNMEGHSVVDLSRAVEGLVVQL